MSIREIARSLYQLRRQLEDLEKKLQQAATPEERIWLEGKLNETRAEYERVRAILEGAKESGSQPVPGPGCL